MHERLDSESRMYNYPLTGECGDFQSTPDLYPRMLMNNNIGRRQASAKLPESLLYASAIRKLIYEIC